VSRRLGFLGLLFTLVAPVHVSADWLITPFVGIKFGGAGCPCPNIPFAVLVDPEDAAGLRKFTYGGSFGLLTDGILGIDADFAHIPGYFNREGAPNTVDTSTVITLTGNVVLAVPASVSRDGLRPYLVGGGGWMRVSRAGFVRILNPTSNRVALNIGGGALGRLSNRSSVRFELRRFTDIGAPDTDLGLSFWRATVGVAFRY
jgi:hypothetical protein